MGVREVRIDGKGAALELNRLVDHVADAEEASLESVRVAESRPRMRVLRIVLRRIIECGNRSVDGFPRRLPEIHHPACVALVGGDRARFLPLDVGNLGPLEHDVESLAQLEDDLVLQGKDVVDPAIDFHRASNLTGRDLDEARGNPHHAAKALIPADHDPGRPETAANIDRERVVQVRIGAEIPQRVVDAGAADDGQPMNVLQIGADGLGDAGTDPVVSRLSRDVRERHHRHGILDWPGRHRR